MKEEVTLNKLSYLRAWTLDIGLIRGIYYNWEM